MFGAEIPPPGLLAASRRHPLAKGEALFRQGDPAYAVFQVESGRVRLIRHSADGRTLTLHVASAGDSFAEAAFFSDRYHCDAMADIGSTVTVFPKQSLGDAMAADPALTRAFMGRLAVQVRDLRALLELRNIRSARDRLIGWLVLAGAERGVTLDRPFKGIASEIGLSHEAMYRTLAVLQRDGTIERTDGRIILKKPI